MTHEEQIRLLNDQLEGAINQRNVAMNECVVLHAQLKAATRRAEAAELANADRREPACANDARPTNGSGPHQTVAE